MLGKTPHRHLYFLGRALSFSLMAGLWALFGMALVGPEMQLVISGLFTLWALTLFFGWSIKAFDWSKHYASRWNQSLSMLLLKQTAWSTFLFGFFTVFLPCGQSLVVFSACALAGSFWVGFFNGFAFALITSPALVLALSAQSWIRVYIPNYKKLMACSALFLALIFALRALANLGLIEHLVLMETDFGHLVLY